MSNNSDYKKKLDKLNDAIQKQKQKIAKAQSKLMTSFNNTQSQYRTPVKKSYRSIDQNTNDKTTSSNTQSTTNYKPGNQKKPVQNNDAPFILPEDPPKNTNTSQTTPNKTKQAEQKAKRQSELKAKKQAEQRAKQQQLQYQRQLEQQERYYQKQKELEQERQKQFQNYLLINSKLKDLLDQKSQYIDHEFYKQSLNWQNKQNQYTQKIEKIETKLQQKQEKILELIEEIAQLKHELQMALQEIQRKQHIIEDLTANNNRLKQQNIEIKLENKNVKADNKIALLHLDKLIKEKQANFKQSSREIFQQRQKRVIDSLYNRNIHIPVAKLDIKQEWLPTARNQLSNKVKLEQVIEQYKDHREQCTRMVRQLEQQRKIKDNQIQIQRKKIVALQKNLQKMSQLRDVQKDANKKKQKLIGQYERQVNQLSQHNEKISDELEKFYRVPRIKEKVGFISRLRKIPENQ